MRTLYPLAALATALCLSAAPAALAQQAPGHAATTFDLARTRTAPLPATDEDKDAAAPGQQIAPNVRLLTEGAILSGYDSNLDLRAKNDPGAFGMVDLGMAIVAGPKDNQTIAVARGSAGRYDIDIRPDRFDFGGLLEHRTMLAPHLSLLIGGFFLRDQISINSADLTSTYYELAWRDDQREAFWRGREYQASYLDKPGSSAANGSIFDVDKTFSYLRSEQSVGLLLLKDRFFAPYAEVGYANLDYYREANPSLFSRSADELWAMGGVRLNISKQLHVDLGVRTNERWFSDPLTKSYSATGFDGKLAWSPSNSTSFEINIDRNFEEAFVPGALVTDRQALTLLANTKLDKNTKLTIDGGLVRYDEIGTTQSFVEQYLEGKLSYQLDKHTELFGSALGQSIKTLETSTRTDDFRILTGVKISN